MPDPAFLNITAGAATQADLQDPARRSMQLSSRVRGLRGDVSSKQPIPMMPTTILLSTNPTTTDTLTIDGQVYEFVTAAGAVAADVNIAVAIGASAAATQTNLLAAINGTAAALHANITNVATTAPAIGVGSKPVFGEVVSNVLRLYYMGAGNQGVDPTSMTQDQMANYPTVFPSFAVSDTLTAVVAWTVLNFNLLPTFNSVRSVHGSVGVRIAITTAMITASTLVIRFPGGDSITGCHVQCFSAAGLQKVLDSTTYVIASGVLTITLLSTGTVDPADTDVLDVIVFGTTTGIQA
jgi:hypothetical protein